MQTQQVAQTIDALAAKLAVPAQHLWEVLVRQARIEAFMFFYELAVCTGLAVLFGWVYRYAAKDDFDNPGIVFGWVICGIALFLSAASTVMAGHEVIGYLLNPEFYAVKTILEALTNK